MIAALAVAVVDIPIFLLAAHAIYGDMGDFRAAWREWGGRIFSVEILGGNVFPPFRILAWLLCLALILSGESWFLRAA